MTTLILMRFSLILSTARFCDSVWQLLLKNVEFVSPNGQPVARVTGKVKIVACDARKLDDRR